MKSIILTRSILLEKQTRIWNVSFVSMTPQLERENASIVLLSNVISPLHKCQIKKDVEISKIVAAKYINILNLQQFSLANDWTKKGCSTITKRPLIISTNPKEQGHRNAIEKNKTVNHPLIDAFLRFNFFSWLGRRFAVKHIELFFRKILTTLSVFLFSQQEHSSLLNNKTTILSTFSNLINVARSPFLTENKGVFKIPYGINIVWKVALNLLWEIACSHHSQDLDEFRQIVSKEVCH